ncbi:DUF3768 domain-containing protein [Sinorhizobium meliloti]|uniref:DUF3768 domain-containing protein n=1 Tax=Rhizobium meliloti TaxID=382 RepID=UPI000FD93F58|nr:DUF3768 domain-containing protein [Sinorhizobium meliloti]RVH97624.1 DUF3768 domain-containing protein [Sinorhizobium meliloti]RVK82297.1 DUF3768 domain-containing protein [Sinorhizobium meliloti]RVL18196.1 DUF3768 domain-containing protein [Sinorhizobium meliloti]RVP39448.1 DUF3768 domain-containing protein [Sinorhizobium meliloti]
MLTRGVQALEEGPRAELLRAVQEFDEFNPANDPYGEHDFGRSKDWASPMCWPLMITSSLGCRCIRRGGLFSVGNETRVDLVTVGGSIGIELTANSVNYLIGSIDPKAIGEQNSFALRVALSYMLDSRREGISMGVRFAGNEPEWFIPPMDQLETYQVRSAFEKCIASLRSKAADFYSPNGGRPEGKTPPFAQSNDSGSAFPPAASTEALVAPASPSARAQTEWRFDTAEEEGSQICFAETEVGGVKVGFMASPGGDVDGLVAGLFRGPVTTTWKVDNKAPHITDGVEDGYFGWHSFEEVSEVLLADVAGGNELRIAKLGEKRLVVPLQGAKQALSSFAECIGGPKPASNVESPQTGSQPVRKLARSCLLQVNGKRVIEGPCSWEPYGSDGTDFQMTANGFFALLFIAGTDNAIGYWNETANSGHAHAELGQLSKSGGCWVNDNVRMCVRG